MLKRWLSWGFTGLLAGCATPVLVHAQAAEYRVVATHGDHRELTCTAVHADRVWFGTLGAGMVRVRGDRTDRFGAESGLPGERVRDCQVDGATLWVATDAGLAHWDARSERFTVMAGGRFLRLAFSAGARLAADGHGRVYALERGRVRALEKLEFTPSALAVSADGRRWAAGSSLGDLYVSGEVSQPRLRSAGLRVAEPIEALRFDADRLEVRTTDHILEYAQSRLRVVHAGPTALEIDVEPSPLMAAPARAAAETNWHGARVVATDRGAFLREPHARTWRPLELGAALPCGDRISALAVHRRELWAGSFDRGVCRRDAAGTWTQFSGSSALPSDMINDLVSDGTRLFIATARGLSVLGPDGQFRQYDHRDCAGRLQRDCPWSASVNGVALDAERGELWVSDLRAVHRIDASGWKHIGGDAVGSLALTKLAARGGELAAGSGDQGVLIGRGKRFERFDDQAGVADNWIMDVTYDASGRLWAATCTRGVSVREHGRFRTLTSEDGLIDDYTLSVNAIGDTIWVGTLSGVSLVHDVRIVQSLSTADGLSGNEVHDAVEFEGQVWLATDAGLSVLTTATSSRPS